MRIRYCRLHALKFDSQQRWVGNHIEFMRRIALDNSLEAASAIDMGKNSKTLCRIDLVKTIQDSRLTSRFFFSTICECQLAVKGFQILKFIEVHEQMAFRRSELYTW